MAKFPLPSPGVRPPPVFEQPKTLVTFSYDEEHNLHIGSDASLRYFSMPPARADLNYGYDTWIRPDEGVTRLDSLLKCLDYEGVNTQPERPSVITWRGIITK